MRNLRPTILSALTCSVLAICFTPHSNAQVYKIEGTVPKFDDLPSPEFSGGKQRPFKPKDWLEIEASFTIQMKPEPPSKTAEKVLIKWYVAVKHPDKPNSFLLLTKDITHVNIPLNEEIFSSVYLSPASIKRLTGADRAGKSSVELVGYEILVNGEKVDQETSKGQLGWWNNPSEKISRSETVPLLNKAETPFANHWWDRYAEILEESR